MLPIEDAGGCGIGDGAHRSAAGSSKRMMPRIGPDQAQIPAKKPEMFAVRGNCSTGSILAVV